jgi:hypothetical protein
MASLVFSTGSMALADDPVDPNLPDLTALPCTPLPGLSTQLVAVDGTVLALVSDVTDVLTSTLKGLFPDAGTILSFQLPDGSTTELTYPPSNFQPATASVDALTRFGFDPPDDPDQLAAWREKFANYSGTEMSIPCIKPSIHHGLVDSGNWAGVVAKGYSNFSYIYDDQKIPNYDASTCGTAVASAWLGLGGVGSGHGLLQQGYDSDHSMGNSADLWWEAITGAGHDNGSVYIKQNVPQGHLISQWMKYTPSTHTTTFHWYDSTTNVQYPSATFTSGSFNGSSYYSGSSAEWISERLGSYPVRKHTYQRFTSAGVGHGGTFADMGTYDRDLWRIKNASNQNIVDANGGPTSNTVVDMYWRRCS